MKLENKIVVITGASRGIGLAIAKQFANRKTHLHLVARTSKSSDLENLKKDGALSVRFWESDLSVTSQVDSLFNKMSDEKIQPDVLVNNAGLLTGGLIEEQNPDDIEKMLMVNTLALIRLTRLFLPGMLARKTGLVVNNASVSGKMFFPCASTYAASKAAVVAFTECVKQELRGTGVSTLLLITPGVKTEMYDDIQKLYGGHLDLSFLDSIPAEKWAQQIVESIEGNRDILYPRGTSRMGVNFAHHFPDMFEKIVRTKFRRN